MPKECEGTKWRNSYVPRNGSKEKAKFRILAEAANGDFIGVFKDDVQPGIEAIAGNCSASEIWFTRLESTPAYLYKGNFIYVNGEKKYIEGTRSEISLTVKEAEAKLKAGNKLLLPPEDWVAEKDIT